MIALDRAAQYVEPLLSLGGQPPHEQIVTAMIRAFSNRCVDDAHARRAFAWLMERDQYIPQPARIYVAIEATFDEPENKMPARRRDAHGEWVIVWRCLTCRDAGLYSRDVTLRNGETYAVCGPCPDCSKGADRAMAYAAKEAEQEARRTGR